MELQFLGPLKNMAGEDRLLIALEEEIRLRQILRHLPSGLASLLPYGEQITNAQLLANLSFFKGGRLLKLDDIVGPQDRIKVMLPATGG